jgi:hypothetical protein
MQTMLERHVNLLIENDKLREQVLELREDYFIELRIGHWFKVQRRISEWHELWERYNVSLMHALGIRVKDPPWKNVMKKLSGRNYYRYAEEPKKDILSEYRGEELPWTSR